MVLPFFVLAVSTEVEVKERKDRVDDALHATRAAVEEGIIAGGGTALLYASKAALEGLERPSNDDQNVGIEIITPRAFRRRFARFAENAGAKKAAVIVGKLLEQDDTNYGL